MEYEKRENIIYTFYLPWNVLACKNMNKKLFNHNFFLSLLNGLNFSHNVNEFFFLSFEDGKYVPKSTMIICCSVSEAGL